MRRKRCVRVDLDGIADPGLFHRLRKLVTILSGRELAWSDERVRLTDEASEVIVSRFVDDETEFDRELEKLRAELGGDHLAEEVDCP